MVHTWDCFWGQRAKVKVTARLVYNAQLYGSLVYSMSCGTFCYFCDIWKITCWNSLYSVVFRGLKLVRLMITYVVVHRPGSSCKRQLWFHSCHRHHSHYNSHACCSVSRCYHRLCSVSIANSWVLNVVILGRFFAFQPLSPHLALFFKQPTPIIQIQLIDPGVWKQS